MSDGEGKRITHPDTVLPAEDLLSKLKSALGRDGDFPASAKVVNEIRQLALQPGSSINRLTELILREPSLGFRLLHLVNSAYFDRGSKPIMTVSQAVVRVGMKAVADLCAGLLLLQKFVPISRRDSAFAQCLKRSLLTSIISSSITKQINDESNNKDTESGYIAGSFAELGTLLLAYYFPLLSQNAQKRAEQKGIPLANAINQITGLWPADISHYILESYNLPPFYGEVLTGLQEIQRGKILEPNSVAASIAQGVFAASGISDSILSGANKEKMDKMLAQFAVQKIPVHLVRAAMADAPRLFAEHCALLEVSLPPLPSFLKEFAEEDTSNLQVPELNAPPQALPTTTTSNNQFNEFLREIKEAVEHHEPTSSIITSSMETLSFALDFDRVVLLLLSNNRQNLSGRMILGSKSNTLNPKSIVRPLTLGSRAPDIRAFNEGRLVLTGDPVLPDGYPFIAIPIGEGSKTIGVIYADRLDRDTALAISSSEQASIGLIAELLHRSVTGNS